MSVPGVMLRKFVTDVFSDAPDGNCARLAHLDTEALEEECAQYAGGLHVATPVFDGANDAHIRNFSKWRILIHRGKSRCMMGVRERHLIVL